VQIAPNNPEKNFSSADAASEIRILDRVKTWQAPHFIRHVRSANTATQHALQVAEAQQQRTNALNAKEQEMVEEPVQQRPSISKNHN
jgi:hypothetical protein